MEAAPCNECDRLFREYADAVAELHRLRHQQGHAAMMSDVPESRALQVELARTYKRRSDSATRLVRHQQQHKAAARSRSRPPKVPNIQ